MAPDGRSLACGAIPRMLDGVELTGTDGNTTASAVCADHLAALGDLLSPGADGDQGTADPLARRARGSEISLAIGWLPPVAETVAQAVSGLMAVHGRRMLCCGAHDVVFVAEDRERAVQLAREPAAVSHLP